MSGGSGVKQREKEAEVDSSSCQISAFPVKPSSPPPPFSCCSQGNRRVDGSFSPSIFFKCFEFDCLKQM